MNAPVTAPLTARARVRIELTQEIKNEARRQLARDGAAALSLRAVARELGMVSSAVYRYFPSRDALLTALIIDAYDAIGSAAEAADGEVERDDFLGRWVATGRAIRAWAHQRPYEYSLVFGSPVPGYAAPEDTIGPASRVPFVLGRILADAEAVGRLQSDADVAFDPVVAVDVRNAGDVVMPQVPPVAVFRAIVAWTQLFGMVSFELYGHLVGSIENYEAAFDQALRSMARYVGVT